MWGPRGSHAEPGATWDKIGVKTTEGPIVTGFFNRHEMDGSTRWAGSENRLGRPISLWPMKIANSRMNQECHKHTSLNLSDPNPSIFTRSEKKFPVGEETQAEAEAETPLSTIFSPPAENLLSAPVGTAQFQSTCTFKISDYGKLKIIRHELSLMRVSSSKTKMPLICKRKMPRRTIDISSEESEGNSINSESDTCTGSDEDYHTDEVLEALNISGFDNMLHELYSKKGIKKKGAHNETKLDKMLYALFRKDVIQKMKKELVSTSKNVQHKPKIQKGKAASKTDTSFIRFSAKYFAEVVSKLPEEKKIVIKNFGFHSLLLFDSSFIPNKFATWIVKKVDLKTSEIVLGDKVIPVNKEAVHAILDLPIGGSEFGKNYEHGRQFILSKFGKTVMPSVKFFGDQLINNEDMTDDSIIISFLIVALATFLCPNSSTCPSIKYLDIFEDVDMLHSFDWSSFVYDWLMSYVKKFQKTNRFGGCLYIWAVLYLDHRDFGSKNVPKDVPRIAVWKQDMVKIYSDLDEIDDENYGPRPLKDFSDTCYYEPVHVQNSESFRNKLDTAIGDNLPANLKDNISDLMDSHFSANHAAKNNSCEDVLISPLQILIDASASHFVRAAYNNVSAENRTDTPTENAIPKSCGKDYPSSDRNADIDIDANLDQGHGEHLTNDLADNNVIDAPNIVHSDGSLNCCCEEPPALLTKIAMEFKSRLAEFNNRDNRGHIYDEDKLAFDIFHEYNIGENVCTPDTLKSHTHGKENEAPANPATFAGPDYMTPPLGTRTRLNNNTYRRHANLNPSQIGMKRTFQDLTNSPNDICNTTKLLTNSSHASIPCINNSGLSSSGGKVPLEDAVNIDNVRISFCNFGNSLKKGGDVNGFVISAFCRSLFHKNHPSKSKKNYFFPSIGDMLISHLNSKELAKIEKSFQGAAMISNLQNAWDEAEESAMDFNSFEIFFPPVPREENNADSGIFVMKSIELWSPRSLLCNEFDKSDIDIIRIQLANKIFFNEKNKMLQTETEHLVQSWASKVSSYCFFFLFLSILCAS
uniref:Ubiquitin-like protease family profile domain-containing protein n=1 Tax=Oryza rufipogon TaxID=4529 RepID=A0A0E0NA98_ORYRU